MNFIPCRIVENDQRKCVGLKTGDNKSYHLPIAESGVRLDPWLNQEVMLGIRPEMISHGFADQGENPQIHEIESVVQVLEPTGPDTLVFVNINGKEVTCRVNPNAAKSPGETMKLMIDMSKALLLILKPEKGLENRYED
jgi:multiple sugar transport system ATP-binding protein